MQMRHGFMISVVAIGLVAVTDCIGSSTTEDGSGKREIAAMYADYSRVAIQKVPRDGFPVLTNPRMVKPHEAERAGWINDAFPVLGIVIGTEARAYPIPKLGFHELVNDLIGDVPVVICWCPLCQTALVYQRTLDGRVVEFGHTGKLYRNGFVMYDKGTRSEWVHVTGECASGKMKGAKVEFLPSSAMTWDAWKKLHPTTLVLGGRGRGGFMGTFVGMTNIAALGFHIRMGTNSKLFSYSLLPEKQLVHDEWQGIPYMVVFAPRARAAAAWETRVGKESLSFELKQMDDGGLLLVDTQTHSQWEPLTGICIEGALKGKSLTPLVGTPILLSRWRAFFPDGELYQEKRK